MISKPAMCVLLWLCVYMQEPAEGGLLKLDKASRYNLGNKWVCILTFEAVGPLDVMWWNTNAIGLQEPLSVLHPMITSRNGIHGYTTVLLYKDAFSDFANLHVKLGDLDGHFFELQWNLAEKWDRIIDLNLQPSTVTPSTDLSYNPGQVVQVSIAVPQNRGDPELTFLSDAVYVGGYFLNPSTGKIEYTGDSPWIHRSEQVGHGVTTTQLTFRTDTQTVNGVLRGQLFGYPVDEDTSPIMSVTESFVLRVHESSNLGPFPDGYVAVDFQSDNGQVVCSFVECYLFCNSYGNDLKTVAIYKEDSSGSRHKQQQTHVDLSRPFIMVAILKLNTRSAGTPGTYVCSAELKSGATSEETITVVAVTS